MIDDKEVQAAKDAFNDKRFEFGGIKTDEQQTIAMRAALEAAERERRGHSQ